MNPKYIRAIPRFLTEIIMYTQTSSYQHNVSFFSLMDWILNQKKEGFETFMIPYPQNKTQFAGSEILKRQIYRMALKHRFTVILEDPPPLVFMPFSGIQKTAHGLIDS